MSSGPTPAITIEHLSRAKTLANDSPQNTLFVRETLGGLLKARWRLRLTLEPRRRGRRWRTR